MFLAVIDGSQLNLVGILGVKSSTKKWEKLEFFTQNIFLTNQFYYLVVIEKL